MRKVFLIVVFCIFFLAFAFCDNEEKYTIYHSLNACLPDVTITEEQAKGLIGKDPEEIKAQIHTVQDVVNYINAAHLCEMFGENEEYCISGYEGLESGGVCCCGGAANLFLYLISDDYEKTGIMRWCGKSSHVIFWVYKNGFYYVIDSTSYLYRWRRKPIVRVSNLKDFKYGYSYIKNACEYEDIDILYAFDHDGSRFPSGQEISDGYRTVTVDPKSKSSIVMVKSSNSAGLSFNISKKLKTQLAKLY